jgi:hypothetical protein
MKINNNKAAGMRLFFTATKVIQGTVLALALDDATGVGVIDDVAIPFLEAANGVMILVDYLQHTRAAPHVHYAKKTVDDLIKEGESEGKTGTGIEVIKRQGGMEQANEDFDNLAVPGSIRDNPNPNVPGGRIAKTPDGKTINVREKSSAGRPTLEVYNPNNKKTEVKFRYDN